MPTEDSRTGLLGELQVEERLIENGWHPVRLDTGHMASNADLIALKGKLRVSIQVKTTNASKKHSHSDSLGFGYSTSYLRDKRSVFNSKESPIVADVVVAVSYNGPTSRFVVLPVAFAEKLCQRHCDYWFSVPTRTEIGKRSHSFPLYLNFIGSPGAHGVHHDEMKRNLAQFEDAWWVLSEPIDKLHKLKAWRLAR